MQNVFLDIFKLHTIMNECEVYFFSNIKDKTSHFPLYFPNYIIWQKPTLLRIDFWYYHFVFDHTSILINLDYHYTTYQCEYPVYFIKSIVLTENNKVYYKLTVKPVLVSIILQKYFIISSPIELYSRLSCVSVYGEIE